jgi:hypothetical protein
VQPRHLLEKAEAKVGLVRVDHDSFCRQGGTKLPTASQVLDPLVFPEDPEVRVGEDQAIDALGKGADKMKRNQTAKAVG